MRYRNLMFVAFVVMSSVLAGEATPPRLLAHVFGDGMVLQRDAKLPIWGFAAPGQEVKVTFAGSQARAKAADNGTWRVELPPRSASDVGRELVVEAGDAKQVARDVLVGDVWLLGGQSNMQYGLGGVYGWSAAMDRIDRGEMKLVRWMKMDQERRAPSPLADNKSAAWLTLQRDTAQRLSASGFFFAERLQPEIGVPVGLLNVPRGGTQMFMWVDAETAAAEPRYGECLRRCAKKGVKTTSADWNGKIASLAGLAIKGVLWYQGETDSWNEYPADNFGPQFAGLVDAWRKAWGRPDLPFVVAQLPSMEAKFWPRVREAQRRVAAEKDGVWLVNLIDTGWRWDVHPHDKPLVGRRLADVALRQVYGKREIAAAPVFTCAAYAPGKARVEFTCEGPLAARGDYRRGFEVRVDGKWLAASSATLADGHAVEVSAPDAAARVDGVRYLYEGWAKPDVWLEGRGGVPAFAFTTAPEDKAPALEPTPPTLFFAGDSTLDDHGGDVKKRAFGSWGTSLRDYLAPGVRLVNYAKSGRSTLSFRTQKYWDRILTELRPGDYVFIQFGHNDQKLDKKGTGVDVPQFKLNLARMVEEVRARGATPLFATPIVRITYENGKLVDAADLDRWAQAMREVAWNEKVPLVDMRRITRKAVEEAGEAEALTWNAPNDRTHPGPKGAKLYAKLFMDDVRTRKLDFTRIFKK